MNDKYGKKQLLTETFPFFKGDYKSGVIREAIRQDQKGNILLTGRLQHADLLNGNERYYPKWILQREIKKYQQKIRNRTSLGEADHPQEQIISIKNVAFLVTEIHWRGDQVVGTIMLLNNSIGKDMQALVKDGVSLSISSRAIGSLRRTDKGDEVQDDLQLVGWDLVVQPSTPGGTFVNESIDNKVYDLVERKQLVIQPYKEERKGNSEFARQILNILKENKQI